MDNKLIIVLLGPQGSGKGTQAKRILDYFGDRSVCIEMGGILREERKRNSDFDFTCSSYMDRGEKLPDHVILEIFTKRFIDAISGTDVIVLDGCARTVEQARHVYKTIESSGTILTIVLDLPEVKCKKRIADRVNYCKENNLSVRLDDTDDEAIQNRLNGYFNVLFPILSVAGDYEIVDARPGDIKVFEKILEKIILKTSQ